MLPHLNPQTPHYAQARGFTAPYVRIATHLGYCIAWAALATDEQWTEARPDLVADTVPSTHATAYRVSMELDEMIHHASQNSGLSPTSFVSQDHVGLMMTIVNQLTEVRRSINDSLNADTPVTRQETMQDLQILADNVAYASAQFERQVTGSVFATEGVNA